MVRIPRIKFGDDDTEEEMRPLGIRPLRKSGGSAVVTLPPEVLDMVDLEMGDDLVVHAGQDSVTLSKLPEE